MKRFIAIVAAAVLMSPLTALAAAYTLDPAHTSIGFKVKHLMVSNVKGVFEKFQGTVVIDDKDVARSKVNVSIDMASINTSIAQRDNHLRSNDFFDAVKYPKMTFVSTRVEKSGTDSLKVTGNLTLRGVTRPVVLNVTDLSREVKSPQGDFRRGASASAVINRQDFGVSWNRKLDAGGALVGDMVTISIDAELVKQ